MLTQAVHRRSVKQFAPTCCFEGGNFLATIPIQSRPCWRPVKQLIPKCCLEPKNPFFLLAQAVPRRSVKQFAPTCCFEGDDFFATIPIQSRPSWSPVKQMIPNCCLELRNPFATFPKNQVGRRHAKHNLFHCSFDPETPLVTYPKQARYFSKFFGGDAPSPPSDLQKAIDASLQDEQKVRCRQAMVRHDIHAKLPNGDCLFKHELAGGAPADPRSRCEAENALRKKIPNTHFLSRVPGDGNCLFHALAKLRICKSTITL